MLIQKSSLLAKCRHWSSQLCFATIEHTLVQQGLSQTVFPDLWLVLATLIGGALSAGSANAFNCYIDADIDKIMGRTKNRPLVTGELSKTEALWFAWIIGFLSVAWLWIFQILWPRFTRLHF